MVDIILKIVEYIGVISFAISGTVIAINKKTDGVGALVFALLSHCQPQLNPSITHNRRCLPTDKGLKYFYISAPFSIEILSPIMCE